jgi:ABC-type xylose transport system permease subunit
MNQDLGLKIVLWLIALYHLVLGTGAFLSAGLAQRVAKSIFGIQLTLDPAMSFVVKVLGIYAIVFGIIVLVAAADPVRYRVLLDIVVVLYALRIVNKLVFKKDYVGGLHIATPRVWTESALLAGFALAVWVLKPA